jgi:hypothetical protein
MEDRLSIVLTSQLYWKSGQYEEVSMPKTPNTTPVGAHLFDCESDHECTMLTCDMCLDELPAEDAIREEGKDYVAHFCGLDCLERWRMRGQRPEQQRKSSDEGR